MMSISENDEVREYLKHIFTADYLNEMAKDNEALDKKRANVPNEISEVMIAAVNEYGETHRKVMTHEMRLAISNVLVFVNRETSTIFKVSNKAK